MSDTEGTTVYCPTTASNLNEDSLEFPRSYGDFVFKSSDGVTFHFPRFLLAHASPVFKEMCQIGKVMQNHGVLSLNEDHATLEQLLCHIDPAKDNPTLDWDNVANLLAAADKYKVKNIYSWFEKEVTFESSKRSPPTLSQPMLCLGLASRYGLDDLARLALRQLVASPVDELKANSHIDSLLVGHLFAMRTARVERLCQIIFGLEGSIVIPCKKHKHTSRVWVQTAVQAMNREPSFEAFLRALDEPISCHCEPPEITAKLEDEFKVTESECDLLSRNELTDEGSLV
ncbi:hypothetical protein CPB86DRAFT_827520 [Serendipita vermifera]|nr:hypothetical protein CPB86DRAFT_827520 [Serendipita vermifera]